jgi:raffinose/stachyose/melibiose transport system substrate-binding protein
MPVTPARATLAKIGALGIAGVVALGLLNGCSSSSSGESSDSAKPSGTLNVLVASADASDTAFKQLNKDFEAKYPDVTVKFSSVPNNDYNAARSSRLTAGNLDVTLASPKEVPSFVTGAVATDDNAAADAGLFTDLSNEEFLKNFTPSVIDSLKYDGKSYTVPTGLSYYTGVFYNKDLFEKNNIEVPTTWSEFQAAAAKLQDAGVAPLGIGGKDGWPAGLAMIASVQSLYPSADDKQTLAKDLWAKDASLSQGTQLEVLKRVQSLYDIGQKNFAGVAYTAIPAAFANGEVAMTVDGTWDQTTIDQAVAQKFEYGYFPLPASDNASDNTTLGGKVELRMAVPTSSKNKTAAMAYLNFFSTPTEYKKFVETTGFAPAQPNIPSSAFLQSLDQYTKTFSPAWDQVWTPNSAAGPAAAFPFNYSAVSPLGTSSADEAAKASQSAWTAGG